MCFGSNIVETTTKQELPEWLESAAKNLVGQTEAVTGPQVPYVPYGGQSLAPITTEQHRARILASISEIDGVILFNEDTPYELIKFIKPDVLVKGKDYKIEDVIGGAEGIKNIDSSSLNGRSRINIY